MIDAACFPGSSGSPVILYDQASVNDSLDRLSQGNKVFLAGILYAGPQHSIKGEVQVVEVPTRHELISHSTIPNNLGLVIKAEKLWDFEPILRARFLS
jgi:hypothetical protein